jgi:DNA-binding MarR family transcriptional regulator
MSVKDDKMNQFVSAMLSLTSAIKNESENCCHLCGDVNEKELMIIVFVGQNKTVKMSEIADNLKAPLSTLTSIADKLVANKFLVRHNSDEDRRVVKVGLGVKGLESYETFLTRRKVRTKKILSRFNEKEHNTLINYISKLADAIVA